MAPDDEEIQRLDSEPPPPGEGDAKTRVGELPEGFLKTLRQGADPVPDVGAPASGRGPTSSGRGVASSWSKAPAAAALPTPAVGEAPPTVPPPGAVASVRGERVPSLSDAVEESELTVMHSSALEPESLPPPAPRPPVPAASVIAPGSLAPSEGFPMAHSTPPVRPVSNAPAPGPGSLSAAASLPPASLARASVPPSSGFASALGSARTTQNLRLGIVALLLVGGGILAVAFALLND